MLNEKFSVVFDTNSYRNLVMNKPIDEVSVYINQLKEKEALKNIIAYAVPVVGTEMLANLAGPGKSPHHYDCLKGLIAMAEHCYDDSENLIHLVPYSYLNITQNFFEIMPHNVALINGNLIAVIGDFKVDYAKALEGHEAKGTFRDLKRYVDAQERAWVGEIENYIEGARHEVLKFHPSIEPKHVRTKLLEYIDSGLFVPFISMSIIFEVARSLQKRLTEKEHTTMGYLLPQIFPLSVGFYQWICHKIVEDNIDMQSKKSREKRWNWRWDYEISFLMNQFRLNERKVLLITADKDVRKMLEQYGYGDRVMDLRAYLEFLEK